MSWSFIESVWRSSLCGPEAIFTKPSQFCDHGNLLFGPMHPIVHWLPNKRLAWSQSWSALWIWPHSPGKILIFGSFSKYKKYNFDKVSTFQNVARLKHNKISFHLPHTASNYHCPSMSKFILMVDILYLPGLYMLDGNWRHCVSLWDLMFLWKGKCTL
jgi:hypothetical protein